MSKRLQVVMSDADLDEIRGVASRNNLPMTKEEALAMRGVGWDGDLDEMRDDGPIEVIDPVEPIEQP